MSTRPDPHTAVDLRTWKAKPRLARLLRAGAVVGPILVTSLFALALIRLLPAPATPGQTVGWWATLGVAVLVITVAADRLFRRGRPLAALYDIDLRFPGVAPARTHVAVKGSDVEAVHREIADGDFDSFASPEEAASRLVEIATAIAEHDRCYAGHLERVRQYAHLIGQELELDDADLNRLQWAALLHDIGKIYIRPSLLNTTQPPTNREWRELRRHPEHSGRLMESLRPWLGDYCDAGRQHHERWDGSGYPDGLTGKDICLAARIVAVADSYDAMTASRSYRSTVPTTSAKAELASMAGSHFDPAVVGAMLRAANRVDRPRSTRICDALGRIPLLSEFGRSYGVRVAAVATALMVIVSASPSGFSPELVAYRNVQTLEDSELRFAIVPEGDELPSVVEITSITGPAAATWEPPHIVVTPFPDQWGDLGLTYRACWPDGSCHDGNIEATIEPVNDPPEVTDDEVEVSYSSVIRISPLSNDTDLDADTLRIERAEVREGRAEVDNTDDELWVTPTTDESQTILLAYWVTDDFGGTDVGKATVVVEGTDPEPEPQPPLPDTTLPAPAPIAPEPQADTASTAEDSSVTIDVLGNDLAPGAALDPATVSISSASLGVAAALADGRILFVPERNSYGLASVVYSVCTVDGACATASVAIEIQRVNDPPYFTAGPDLTVAPGSVVDQPWATDISVGEDNEPYQVIDFFVTTDRPDLFVETPTVDGSGQLRFVVGSEPGVATLTVIAGDGELMSFPASVSLTIG